MSRLPSAPHKGQAKEEPPLLYPENLISGYLGMVVTRIRRCDQRAIDWVRSEDFTDWILAWEYSMDISLDFWRTRMEREWNNSCTGSGLASRLERQSIMRAKRREAKERKRRKALEPGASSA